MSHNVIKLRSIRLPCSYSIVLHKVKIKKVDRELYIIILDKIIGDQVGEQCRNFE